MAGRLRNLSQHLPARGVGRTNIPTRELKVGDRVQSHSARQRGRIYVVLELVTVRTSAGKGGALRSEDVSGARLGSVDGDRDYVHLPVDRIHTDGKSRKSGWSLVMP